jgi:RNA polymerase sigma-70 factor (ECF subfamily)
MKDADKASDVFSQMTEDLWKGLPKFRMECSPRTWLYLLSRHAAERFERSPSNRPHASETALEELADAVRSRTPLWHQTDTKNAFRSLREELSPDDRSLLALRIDRDLPWADIARVFLGDTNPDAHAIQRESARLRKRLQLLKEELRKLAQERGLIED